MGAYEIQNLKVIFVGCARDCAPFIQKSLDNIKYYSSFFKESFKIIVENGSKDKTREILKSNQDKNSLFLFEDHLDNLKTRGLRLQTARNIIISSVKSNPKLRNYDLFINMDLDGTGNFRINKDDFIKSIKFINSQKNIGAVFANQLGTYYDMWTLRDKNLYKNDFWGEILQMICAKSNYNKEISKKNLEEVQDFINKNKTISFDRSQKPIKVLSAFGGFGIYKIECIINNKKKYNGSQNLLIKFKDEKKINVNYQKCEHVDFNLGIIEQNYDLFILPFLINRDFLEVMFPVPAAFKLIIK